MNSAVTHVAQKPWWLVVSLLIAAIWTVSACGSSSDEASGGGSAPGSNLASTDLGAPQGAPNGASPGATSSSGGGGGGEGSSGAGGTRSSSGTPDGDPDAGSSGSIPTPGPAPVPGATEANLKVAFVADTNAGDDYKDVLALIKREGADLVVFQGDLTYAPTTSAQWLAVTDAELDNGATKIPYLVARGNHDVDWKGLGEGLETRLGKSSIALESGKPSVNGNYSVVYKGLKLVFADDTETGGPTRTDHVTQRLAGDKQIWKICAWHRNMRNTNAGSKGDEMPWSMYEACRAAGAIVAQGHSHTYSRSKTVTNDQAVTVDPACSDPYALCVGPGKHFFFDSSLGGVGLRTLETTSKPHWASTYSQDYGALFIEFNVDGDARKARGYFKTVKDEVIDPPPSTGKTSFTLTSSNPN